MTTGEFIYEVTTKNAKCMVGIVPACNGREVPFQYKDHWILYTFDVFSRCHGYMDLTGEIYVDIDRTCYLAPGAIA